MDTVSAESSNRKDLIAAGLSLIIVGLIAAGIYFWTITIPIPPFPEKEFEIMEIGTVDIGNNVEGFGNVDYPGMGNGAGENANTTPSASSDQPENDSYTESDVEPSTPIKSNPTPVDNPTKTDVQPKTESELDAALNAFRNNKGNSSGGDGNASQPGDKGDPNGHPDGDGKNFGIPGPGNGGYSLKGRTMVRWPDKVKDSKEEGKVIVGIVVDKKGNVIKAEPGEPGSTTTSAYLYMLARQAARTAKFNPSPDGAEEQYGTITFVFVLQ